MPSTLLTMWHALAGTSRKQGRSGPIFSDSKLGWSGRNRTSITVVPFKAPSSSAKSLDIPQDSSLRLHSLRSVNVTLALGRIL